MIADRDTDRLLRAWFQEPAAPLPDDVLDAVLEDVHAVRQRRRWLLPTPTAAVRSRARLAFVVVTVLALLGGLLLVAGGRIFEGVRQLSIEEGRPIDPGSYVVDSPFPTRFGIDLGPGWIGIEHTSASVSIALGDGQAPPELHVLLYDAVYAQPCHPEEGLLEPLGPSAEDLARVISAAPDLRATAVAAATVGGLPAFAVEVTPPGPFVGCRSESELLVFGLPNDYGIVPDLRHRFWVLAVGDQRVTIAARDAGPATPSASEIDAAVRSIRFGVPAAPAAPTRDGPSPPSGPSESPFALLPENGPVPPGVYRFPIEVFAPDASGRFEPLPGRYEGAFEAPAGWIATDGRLANGDAATATASFGVWTIATIYRDPCHWQSGTLPPIDAATLPDVHALAGALTDWWGPVPDPDVVPPGYEPPAEAPLATRPLLQPWNSRAARELGLDVPQGIDLDDCDQGEYRLWADPHGSARTARPGEHVHVVAIDMAPAILVVNPAALPTANAAALADLDTLVFSTWIGEVQ